MRAGGLAALEEELRHFYMIQRFGYSFFSGANLSVNISVRHEKNWVDAHIFYHHPIITIVTPPKPQITMTFPTINANRGFRSSWPTSFSKTISNVELMSISSQTHQPPGMMIKINARDHATVVSKEKPDVSPILTEQMHFPIIILHASLSNLVICQASVFRLRRMECFFVIFEKNY